MIKKVLIFLCLSSLGYSEEYLIKLNHTKQDRLLCVPACVSIILNYYGQNIDQKELKRLIENNDFKDSNTRLYTKTKFWKVERVLKQLGYNWQEKRFNIDSGNNGIEYIKKEIQNNNPVIVSVDKEYGQHAFILNGFGKDYFIVTDPNEDSHNIKYTFKQFRTMWNSDGHGRYLLKTQNKRE
jgi:ABC-type bacteriocin/lantibiotic exporter with double-glycine peptidase domain